MKKTTKAKIERLENLINALESDINNFGPAGNDLSRLDSYKKELRELIK